MNTRKSFATQESQLPSLPVYVKACQPYLTTDIHNVQIQQNRAPYLSLIRNE